VVSSACNLSTWHVSCIKTCSRTNQTY
jgi:hypothetical protein